MLKQLTLTDFRNYSRYTLSFSNTTTVLIGPNTSGKTSILEAISLLSSGSSFRAETSREVISETGEVAHVTGVLSDATKLDLTITGGMVSGKLTPKKIFKVNGVEKPRFDFVGRLVSVLFWPEDLRLVTGSPSRRRAYLDTVLSQRNRLYRRSLSRFETALRMRNKLLVQKYEGVRIGKDEFEHWEKELVLEGNRISQERSEFITYFNNVFDGTNLFTIHYAQSEISKEGLEDRFSIDMQNGTTGIGPHRDDFTLFKKRKTRGDRNIRLFGSRGEQRLGVLTLKRAELQYLEQSLGVKPMLLLDDIFSELDRKHREDVLSLIPGHQTVITATEFDKTLFSGSKEQVKLVTLG